MAGPGFVNLFLSDAWYRRALRSVLDIPVITAGRIEFEAEDWRMLGTAAVRRTDFFVPARK